MWTVIVSCALMVAAGWSQGTDENWRVVTITQGALKGYKAPNHDVFQFLNVPYANAPVGQQRFRAPMAPPIWWGDFEAVDRGIICPQVLPAGIGVAGQAVGVENCLVANIYVPNTSETNLPVLVVVHGGGYASGSGKWSELNDIASSKNVVVVTFNYRLGPHGFLCLGTEDVPGNAGMKDQVALLQWVQNNIASFGGNPDDVTIYGCSAGGSAVDLLMLSTMTNGLFSKVIAESGCSMNIFSTQLNPLQNARNHAVNFGFTNVTDLNALEEFYKSTPIHNLLSLERTVSKNSYLVFQPCVEKNIGQQRFLEDAPINILKSGNFKKLPVIYGYAKQEGMLRLREFGSWSVEMNESFGDFLPADLQFVSEEQKVKVAQDIKEFYFGNNAVGENTVLNYVDYFTDVLFLPGILRNVELMVKAGHSQVYLYEYSFTHNGSQVIPHTNGLQGATHCDQFVLITDSPVLESLSEEKIVLQATMRDVIYNFMTTGNPTPPDSSSSLPVWPPAGVDSSPHYSVGHNISVGSIPAENRAIFWDEMYKLYGVIPQPPIELPEVVPTPPSEATEPTPQETETTPQETETTPQELSSTTQEVTESTAEDITDPEDIETTTPQPDTASQLNIFSYQFWILHAIIVLMVFK